MITTKRLLLECEFQDEGEYDSEYALNIFLKPLGLLAVLDFVSDDHGNLLLWKRLIAEDIKVTLTSPELYLY